MILNERIEFYSPGKKESKKSARLYSSIDGIIMLEFTGRFTPGNMKSIEILYAIHEFEETQYSLVNCVFKKAEKNILIYIVNEIYLGAHIENVNCVNCLELTSDVSGMTRWINQPRAKPSFANEGESKIIIKDFYSKIYQISNNFLIEVIEYLKLNFDYNGINLKYKSELRLKYDSPVSRLEANNDNDLLSRFMYLFTELVPKKSERQYIFENNIEVKLLNLNKIDDKDGDVPFLSHEKVEDHFQKMIDNLFSKKDSFSQILDLLISSETSKTPEVSFLNITAGLEVFHTNFYEKGNKQLVEELSQELLEHNIITKPAKDWIQILRYFHLFKSISNLPFTNVLYDNKYETVQRLLNSRNYYTHYNKKKNSIWTRNNLYFENRKLRQILKTLVLKQLGLTDELLNKNMSRISNVFYRDYESNEFSINYLKKE